MRRLVPAVLLLACAATVAQGVYFSGSLIDDAYIFFRYADNVLSGHGPVFNPGEAVEGFTSPLWLALLVAGRSLGAAYGHLATWLGVAFAVASVGAAWWLARRVAGPVPALLGAALLGLHPAFAMWAVHGLETALFVPLVACGVAFWLAGTDRGAALAGLILGVAFWTRPEAALPPLVLAGAALVRGEVRRSAGLLLAFAAAATPLELARFAYYGDLVPNTFHAKTGGGIGQLLFGLSYAKGFVLAHAPLVAVCAAATWIAMFRARPSESAVHAGTRRGVLDLAAVGIAWSAYVVWVGGDGFPAYRFWLPVVPLAGAVTAWGLERIAAASPAGARIAAAFGVATPLFIGVAAVPEARLEHESGREFTAKMTVAGKWLRRHAPPGTWIAVNYVGAVPYHSGLPTIDMLGLTEPAIARTPIRGRFRFPGHARSNGAAVLDRRPGLILMGGVWVEPEPMIEPATEMDTEEQIADDPRFASEYEPVNVAIEGPDGPRWFGFYKRKDLDWEPGVP